ncbi:hypothetical protein HK103_000615 [Boothiomyces macroporosus]|uniref:DUF747-domain-containing protein n=1 Tax=Boothiomyces macroporosus TaxID=261099 RepID=A0AAD5Y5G2_9FUNG|nr:hypothetical protein HK103_000615 [Boothiomyces macroporosus]
MAINEHPNTNLIKKKKKKRKNTDRARNDSVPDLFPQASLKSLDSQEGYEKIVAINESNNVFFPDSKFSTDPITSNDRIGTIDIEDDTPDTRPSTPTQQKQELKYKRFGISAIWDYFVSEITSTFQPEQQQAKTERILNFISVPRQLEKFVLLGFFICLDSFLYIFTILPIRILIATYSFFSGNIKPAQKTDLIKGTLIVICSYFIQNVDSSRLYHLIRGQAIIKLYFIFNALEIGDKLCSAFGHDILDSLFATTADNQKVTTRRLNRIVHFIVASFYISLHTLVLFYQVMALNVAVNSYNNGLLTLLMSNQFTEIKGSVFKKFEKANLFQLSCSDIVERFQLSTFLFIITIRNCLEILGNGAIGDLIDNSQLIVTTIINSVTSFITTFDTTLSIDNFSSISSSFYNSIIAILNSNQFTLVQIIIGPAVVVYGTEIMVDWIKHAFIVKFNGISPKVYQRYSESLCRDLLGISSAEINQRHVNQIDRSPIVAKRIGFVSIPLACLVIRVGIQIMGIIGIMPETLMEETWEEGNSTDEMIGSWKLPDKLNQWIKKARSQRKSQPFLLSAFTKRICLQNYAVKSLIDLKQEKEELPMESVLRTQTPNHFLPPEMFKAKRELTSPTSNEKLDSIDRFTMVKSRIV